MIEIFLYMRRHSVSLCILIAVWVPLYCVAISPNYTDPVKYDDRIVLYKWLGLVIVIVSAIASNLGVNIQKRSHTEQATLVSLRKYYTRPLWILGMICIVVGAIGDLGALAFAPQALVASVGGGCTVLANVFFAHVWLKQNLTRADVIGTVLILGGIVLSAFVNEPDAQLSVQQLELKFLRSEFLIYDSITIAILLFIAYKIPRSQLPSHVPFLYAIASGIVGSYSVLLAKCGSMLMLKTVRGENQFVYLTTYICVGGTVITLLVQTDLLNRAIMVGDTLKVFPIFQCFWIGCSVVGGVIFHEKYIHFSAFEWTCLPSALLLIIAGIYMLAQCNVDEMEVCVLADGDGLMRVIGFLSPTQGLFKKRESISERKLLLGSNTVKNCTY